MNAKSVIKRVFFRSGILAVLTLLITAILLSCGQSNQKPAPQQQSSQSEQPNEKIPDQLKAMESGIEKIISTLGGPSAVPQEETPKDSSQTGQGQQPSSQDKGGSDKQEGQGGKDQGKQQAQQSQPSQEPWEKITPVINTLHYQWNSYMPMAAKSGASKALIDNFSNSLNNLTTTIMSKNKLNSLLASSMLYSNIPDFYSLYRTKTSPEIKKVRHYTRDAVINASTSNWQQAEADISSLKSSWSLLKSTISKDQQENANKIDFSFYEIEKVVKDKNPVLTDIKGRVALSAIDGLEKSQEKAQ